MTALLDPRQALLWVDGSLGWSECRLFKVGNRGRVAGSTVMLLSHLRQRKAALENAERLLRVVQSLSRRVRTVIRCRRRVTSSEAARDGEMSMHAAGQQTTTASGTTSACPKCGAQVDRPPADAQPRRSPPRASRRSTSVGRILALAPTAGCRAEPRHLWPAIRQTCRWTTSGHGGRRRRRQG